MNGAARDHGELFMFMLGVMKWWLGRPFLWCQILASIPSIQPFCVSQAILLGFGTQGM